MTNGQETTHPLLDELKPPTSALAALSAADRAELEGWSRPRLQETYARLCFAMGQAQQEIQARGVLASQYLEICARLMAHYGRGGIVGADGKPMSLEVTLPVADTSAMLPGTYRVPFEPVVAPDGQTVVAIRVRVVEVEQPVVAPAVGADGKAVVG